jgi:hypothetical protein
MAKKKKKKTLLEKVNGLLKEKITRVKKFTAKQKKYFGLLLSGKSTSTVKARRKK